MREPNFTDLANALNFSMVIVGNQIEDYMTLSFIHLEQFLLINSNKVAIH